MPKWVEDCVKAYMAKGYSKEEAWKRCNGALQKQKDGEKRSRGTKKPKKG